MAPNKRQRICFKDRIVSNIDLKKRLVIREDNKLKKDDGFGWIRFGEDIEIEKPIPRVDRKTNNYENHDMVGLNDEGLDWVGLEWICFEDKHTSVEDQQMVEEFETKQSDSKTGIKESAEEDICVNMEQIDDGTNWIFGESDKQNEDIPDNNFEAKNQRQRTDDGLDWLYFDDISVEDQLMGEEMQIKRIDSETGLKESTEEDMAVNMEQMDDGINWTFGESHKTNEDIIFDFSLRLEKQFDKNKSKPKNRFDTKPLTNKSQELSSDKFGKVFWNFREFEDIPSQRPYFRI